MKSIISCLGKTKMMMNNMDARKHTAPGEGKSPHKRIPGRSVIYAKDIMNITGRSSSSASRCLQDIRKSVGKLSSAWVTVEEFCAFTELDVDLVRKYLV